MVVAERVLPADKLRASLDASRQTSLHFLRENGTVLISPSPPQ